MNFDYTIKKPAYPIAAYVLSGLVVLGLIGLGIAAFAAFAFIGRPVQALAFALIIEAGMVGESLALIRRNWLAIPGLIISLIVSGMYNYTQAAQAGAVLTHPITDPAQLAALSIGPLSAVFFLALSLGFEIRSHETAVKAWEKERQQWIDGQAAKAETARVQARQMELEAKEKAMFAELQVKERELLRQERREARAARVEASRQKVEVSTQLPGTAVATSRGTYADFEDLLRGNGHREWKNIELSRRFHVSTRTITDWRKRFQEEHALGVEASVN